MEVQDEIRQRYAGRPAMALVALQEIQTKSGYIPDGEIRPLAKALGIPEGDLRGLITFYSEFRVTPPGSHHIAVCEGDSCAALDSHAISSAVASFLQETPDSAGQFSCGHVYCLGNCAFSPAVSVDGEVYGRVTPEGITGRLRSMQDD